MKQKTNKQNNKIEIGFNIQIKPIIKKGLIGNIKDYEILNKELEK